MIFCTACGRQIHETAVTCPGCGAVQPLGVVTPDKPAGATGCWMPVASVVLGGICLLTTFADERWSKDEAAGFLILLSAGAALGLIALGRKTGKGLAITGIALSAVALIAFIGSL